MAGEWETRRKNSVKSEDQRPTLPQDEGAETESKTALLYFQPWMKEYVWSEAIIHVAFRNKEQNDH